MSGPEANPRAAKADPNKVKRQRVAIRRLERELRGLEAENARLRAELVTAKEKMTMQDQTTKGDRTAALRTHVLRETGLALSTEEAEKVAAFFDGEPDWRQLAINAYVGWSEGADRLGPMQQISAAIRREESALVASTRAAVEAIRAEARREALLEAAEEFEASFATRDTNDGSTYCSECGAPQGVPWTHDSCPVAVLRAKAAEVPT